MLPVSLSTRRRDRQVRKLARLLLELDESARAVRSTSRGADVRVLPRGPRYSS